MLYLRHTILMLDMENQSDIIIVLAMLVGILYQLYLVLCTITITGTSCHHKAIRKFTMQEATTQHKHAKKYQGQ